MSEVSQDWLSYGIYCLFFLIYRCYIMTFYLFRLLSPCIVNEDPAPLNQFIQHTASTENCPWLTANLRVCIMSCRFYQLLHYKCGSGVTSYRDINSLNSPEWTSFLVLVKLKVQKGWRHTRGNASRECHEVSADVRVSCTKEDVM
jgi:hypothetical protein